MSDYASSIVRDFTNAVGAAEFSPNVPLCWGRSDAATRLGKTPMICNP